MRKLRAVEVREMFNEFYEGRVNENKKEVIGDLDMFLNRYYFATKYVVELERCRQNKGMIELYVRVSVSEDTEHEFMDFMMTRTI